MTGLRNETGQHGRLPVTVKPQDVQLLRFLRARLANEEDAEDLAQEAYLRLLRASDTKLIRDPVAYLFRIARNLVYEWYTSRPPSSESLDDVDVLDEGLTVEALANCNQQIDRLEAVLQHLPPKCRAAIVMHRRDGMTYEEIASALDVSPAMVKKYLSQGLSRCRARLRRFHE